MPGTEIMAEATCQYHHAVTVKHGSQGCTGQRTAEPSGPKHTHKKEVTEAVSLSPKSKKAQGNMWERIIGRINKRRHICILWAGVIRRHIC